MLYAYTKPVVDNVETVKYIIEKGEKTGLTNVLPVGAVTKNMAGVEITDVEELKKARNLCHKRRRQVSNELRCL